MTARVIQCFMGADLRCGHEGLAATAKKDGIIVEKLTSGKYVVFINTKKNKLKLYAANNVVAYLKLDGNRKIDLNTIKAIPEAFNASGQIDYDKLLKNRLQKDLGLVQ